MSIQVSDRLDAVLAGRTFRMVCRATITRGGQVLADDLPVHTGQEECDATLKVPERVTLHIPRVIDGIDWSADALTSPLSPFGQRVHVKLGISVGADGYEWINRGEFLLHDVDTTGPRIVVVAVGLLALLDEAKMVAPYKPTGTIATALRKLVEPALTVRIDPGLTDRAVSTGLAVDQDRLQGVLDLLDAWPAEARVTPDGYLHVTPVDAASTDPNEPSLYVQRYHFDGYDTLKPNVTEVATSTSRDGVTNAMVVRGQTADGAPISGVAYDTSGGPASYGGPFNPLPVPEFFSHGTVRTVPIATAVARAMLKRKLAPFRRAWKVDMVPQPRYLLGDQVTYYDQRAITDDGTHLCRIERLVMPYTASSGRMQMTIREIDDA